MKQDKNDKDMLPEYDFSKGIRGKYAQRCLSGTNIVVIDGDLHEYFPDQKSVNEALRGLVHILERKRRPKKALHTVTAKKTRGKLQHTT